MPRTIANLKDDLSRKLHGTNLNNVEGLFGIFDEGAREVLNEIDFFETKRTALIANAIYSDVYDYALPADLKGNKIYDLAPQVNRAISDFPQQTYEVEFGRHKELQKFTINDNGGVRTLRYNAGVNDQIVIHTVDSITANGTWTVGDDGLNLTLDTLNYVSGNASLNFDVSGVGTTVSIQNTTMTAVDLSTLEDQGSIFIWVYTPVAITAATLNWGDDLTGNYWADTITSPQNGSFQIGWNLLRFDWNGATETGSPDSSEVVALKLSMTYDGNVDTDYRMDNIVASLGETYEIKYYSKYLFQNTAGTWIEEVAADTDSINLSLEGYDCYLYKCLELVAPQVQAEDAAFDLNIYTNKYSQARDVYRAKYKSEMRLPSQKYYRSTVRNRRGSRGGRFQYDVNV